MQPVNPKERREASGCWSGAFVNLMELVDGQWSPSALKRSMCGATPRHTPRDVITRRLSRHKIVGDADQHCNKIKFGNYVGSNRN